ncbi:type II secretion system protein [Deinococcus sp. Leaf326]|uniref:type II secretion system protein n=1 Tax=Deinococcus sp. Leaf326 TaxID=1736338 RepID=UPI0006F22416|nr:type II secretion system protein [Deinococcus sp. Leaf326]KQR17923.1 hypothetical protein ASF71_20260 [Deinococcus sp. Leaf326]
MSILAIYSVLGLLITMVGILNMPRHKWPTNFKGVLALVLGSLFWPVVLLALWYDRQRATWKEAPPVPKAWLKVKEQSGAYTLGPVTLIVRYRPRRCRTSGRWTILVRPRPSLDAPLLIRRQGFSINLLFRQYHFLMLAPVTQASPIPAPSLIVTPRQEQAFTLVEILIVIAMLGILAAVLLPNFLGARGAAQHKLIDTYTQTCQMTAEKRRNYLTNTLTLPAPGGFAATCATLGVTPPSYITKAEFLDQGDRYELVVQGQVRGGTYTQSATLIKQVTR